MKSISLLLILLIFTIGLSYSSSITNHHYKPDRQHHNNNHRNYTFNRHAGRDPKNEENSCIVNKEFSQCFSGTCPSISQCVNYLNSQSSMNIYITAGNYSICDTSFLNINFQVNIKIDVYNDGDVYVQCQNLNSVFLDIRGNNGNVQLQILNINILGTLSSKSQINLIGNPSQVSTVTIKGSSFTSCQLSLSNSNIGGGSALNAINYSVFIQSSNFINNVLYGGEGGGAIFSNYNLDIHSSLFVNNIVVGSSSGGGAIFSTGNIDTTNIVLTVFQNNSAQFGGAIVFEQTSINVNLDGSVFENNTALTNGSAIYIVNNNSTILFLGGEFSLNSNSTFTSGYIESVNTVKVLTSAECPSRAYIYNELNDPSIVMSVCVNVFGECYHGNATVDSNGSVIQCQCDIGYEGTTCNTTSSSSSNSSSNSSSSSTSSQGSSSSDIPPSPAAWLLGVLIIVISIILLVFYVIKHIFN